jgi:hypothetical protein
MCFHWASSDRQSSFVLSRRDDAALLNRPALLSFLSYHPYYLYSLGDHIYIVNILTHGYYFWRNLQPSAERREHF